MSKSLAKIIVYGLVALLVVAAIGLVYKFTNGFNEDFKTFYVECDGNALLTTDNEMVFTSGNVYKFDVKYTFDKADSEAKGYKVKIVPNVEKDFEFTVGSSTKLYSKQGDMIAAFDVEMTDTSFEIYIEDGTTIQSVLSKVYEGQTVSVPYSAEVENTAPFKLVISSYNEKASINIVFSIGGDRVTGVAIDNTDLVFDNKSFSS